MNLKCPFLGYGLVLLGLVSCEPSEPIASKNLVAPAGEAAIGFNIDKGGRSYLVLQKDSVALLSRIDLGLVLQDAKLKDGLTLVNTSETKRKTTAYSMLSGKVSTIKNTYAEKSYTLTNSEDDTLKVEVMLSDTNLAFRYVVPRNDRQKYRVVSEHTSFHVPQAGHAWIEPYDTLQKWGPAHEVGYVNKMPIGTNSSKSTGWGFPALFKIKDQWLLLTEADVHSGYVASHFDANCEDGVYKYQFPWHWENYDIGDVSPTGWGTLTTPWRVVSFGALEDVFVTTVVTDVAAENRLAETDWIEPGIASWSWWGDTASPKYSIDLKEYVDLSAEMGWPYTLVDADWHIMEEGNIQEVIQYANDKGVKVLLWYNSAGPYTKVLEVGPIDRLHTHELRMKEFSKLQEWGVAGIKVDFFQSDKQHMMKYYEDLMEDAAQFNLLVNTHSSTVPRGWHRTYPNYLASEAVKGAEMYPNGHFSENAPMWNTILPFTRNIVGPMDYTPVTFSNRGTKDTSDPVLADSNPALIKRVTSLGHELALSVVFECGIQHFADRAQSYLTQPDYVIDFLKEVPVAWDDTMLLDGYPGEFAVVARRKGDAFYLGGINGLSEFKKVNLDLGFLNPGEYDIRIITDARDSNEFEMVTLDFEPSSSLDLTLKAFGGFVAIINSKNDYEGQSNK